MKRNIKIYQIISILIAYSGLLLTFADKFSIKSSHLFWYGAVLIVLSSFTYAIFLVMSDGLISRLGPIRFTNIAILTMSGGIILHAIFTGKAQVYGFDHHVYANCLLMSVFSTVIPVYMFNYAIGKLGSSKVSIISCAGPVCTLMYSSVLLSEKITIFQILGTIVVVTGIMSMYLKNIKLVGILTRKK